MRAGIRAAAGHAMTIRSMPQLLITTLGLMAVLAGILGMHMLADPHPAAASSGTAHSAVSHSSTAAHSNTGHASTAATDSTSTTPDSTSTTPDSAGTARHPADPAPAAAPASDDAGGGHTSGACPECGPAGCAAGLCMMFLVLVSITAVLGLLVSRRYRNPDRPGTPCVFPAVPAPPATPSLVQLCISRT